MSVTKKFIKDSMTGKDNETYDAIRILSVLSIVIALGLTVYVVVWKDKPFNIQDYGIGLGLIFAAVGAALKLKESTEPGHRRTLRTRSVDQKMIDKVKVNTDKEEPKKT